MSTPNDLNCRLAELLGINWRTHDVMGFTLQVRGTKWPTVTVERQLFSMGEVDRTLRSTTERFTLQPAPTPATTFDLDRMVSEAQRAVAKTADDATRREHQAVALRFSVARERFDAERVEWKLRQLLRHTVINWVHAQ